MENRQANQQRRCFALTCNDLLDRRASPERGAETVDLCDICEKPLIAETVLEEFFLRIWDVHLECSKNDFSLD